MPLGSTAAARARRRRSSGMSHSISFDAMAALQNNSFDYHIDRALSTEHGCKENLMTHGLLAIGLTTLDILGRPIDAIPADGTGRLIDEIELVPAGTAGGTALVAAKLGLKTKLLSALGADRI